MKHSFNIVLSLSFLAMTTYFFSSRISAEEKPKKIDETQIAKTSAHYTVENKPLYAKMQKIANQAPDLGYLDGSDPNPLDEYKILGSCEIFNIDNKEQINNTEVDGFCCKLYGLGAETGESLTSPANFILLLSSIRKVGLEIETKIIGWYKSPTEIAEVKSALLRESLKLSLSAGEPKEKVFSLFKNVADYGQVSNKEIFGRLENMVNNSPKVDYDPHSQREIAILKISESIISPQTKKTKGEKSYRATLWEGVIQIDLCIDYDTRSRQIFSGYYKSNDLQADVIKIIEDIKTK